MNSQITFRGFDSSDSVRNHVEVRTAKLADHNRHIVSLKVALEAPHHHHEHGSAFHVRIELIVPGGDIVISPRDGRDGHSDLYVAIDDAFAAAQRRLDDHARVRRGDVKSHGHASRVGRHL